MTQVKPPLLERISLTGPDDKIALSELAKLSALYPIVEWALLYTPHNLGAPRNPTLPWLNAFFEAKLPGYSAVHLCGSLAFEQLLNGRLPAEILKADRLQLNINARKREFTDEQVLAVYRRALHLGPDVILQYHEGTAELAHRFLAELSPSDQARVHVLLDASKGKGVTPSEWARPAGLGEAFCGFAGGLGPDNLAGVLPQLEGLGKRYWPDMESGLRTDNEFDMTKVARVLQIAEHFRKAGTALNA